MDDLAAAFSGAVGVSFSADSSATQHPRMCMYKARESKQSQWERRHRKLQEQREKRKDYSNIARQLAEEDYANITLSEDEEDGMDQSAPTAAKEQKNTQKRKKKERYYSNQLMLSEWLDDVPEDMAENWLMVPCPVGKRTFVLASMGKTRHYTKSGYCVNTFHSGLPGGSVRQSKRNSTYTVLDCVYSDATQTYWVLDIMCWRGHPVYDSETEFRFFWLQSQLAENPDLATGSKKNPQKFCALPSFRCDKQTLQEAMASPLPFKDELDGLLFYHKALHYVPGVTPLIGWLKPWMVPEILGVPIPESLAAKKPPGASLRPPSASSMPTKPGPTKEKMETTSSPSQTSKEKMEVASSSTQAKKKTQSSAKKMDVAASSSPTQTSK